MSRNDLGIPQITRMMHDPGGTGVLSGRALLHGPGRNQAQKGQVGYCEGVTHYNRKHGQDNAIQTEGFAVVESAGAVAINAAVYINDAEGRVGSTVGTPANARVGTAMSATAAAGERLKVDLSRRNG